MLYLYHAAGDKDNAFVRITEYFRLSFCRSDTTGKPKTWLKFNGKVYKLSADE